MGESTARFHAILSAYLSIAAGVIEAVLSMLSGHKETSMSLYGIALMAFVDVTGSILVLQLWQCSSTNYAGERLASERRKEMNYSIIIGSLMIFLGFFLIADSLQTFIYHHEPKSMTSMGTIVAVFGSLCGISLAIYKYVVGKALDSPVVIAGNLKLCKFIKSLQFYILFVKIQLVHCVRD